MAAQSTPSARRSRPFWSSGHRGLLSRALIGSVGVVAVLAGCSASRPARKQPPPVESPAAAPNPSVVAVMAGGGGSGGVSTGFFVGSNLLVTCRHSVAGCSRMSMRFADGKRGTVQRVLAESPANDLAALEAASAGAVPLLRLSERPARVGDAVRVVWAKNSRTQRTDRASVTRAERLMPRWGPVFEIRAPLALGCSGAPVLDERDQVVGVVIAGDPDLGVFYAVPERFLRALAAKSAAAGPAAAPPSTPTVR